MVEKRIRPTVIRRRVKPTPFSEADEPSESEVYASTPLEALEEDRPFVSTDRVESGPKDISKKPMKKIKKPEPARIIEMAPKPEPVKPVVHKETEPASPRPGVIPPPPGIDLEPSAEIISSQSEPRTRTQGTPEAELRPGAEPGPAPGSEEATKEARTIEHHEAKMGVSQPSSSGAARIIHAPGSEPRVAAPPQTEADAGSEERRGLEDRPKKKKKKEKRMQPAQIIGKVELRKEPPREPERVERVERVEVVERTDRPQRVEQRPERTDRPQAPRPAYVPPAPQRKAGPAVTQFVPEMTEEEKRKKKKKDKDKKVREVVEEKVEDKSLVRRRKEVVLRNDLYDDRVRPGKLRGKGRKTRPRKPELTTPKASKRRVKLPATVSVSSLAHKMSVKAADVIQHLMTLGVTASMNENIDYETAVIVAAEFGFEAESAEQNEKDLLPAIIKDTDQNLVSRPPVVTVMGHVDHGKTSLLDAIRSTHVIEQEAGGITQHIGAYKVRVPKGELVFLDTPGHEAFTAMRARGAQVTDFVVLVVAADDGVMDQTVEAINHARAAKVPIIVAVNKIDKPDADPDRVIRELSQHELIPEAWGGETLFAYVSAKLHQGIDEVLDLVLLQAEMMELKANPDKRATGTVIEARLDKGKGPVATVLVKEGTLKLHDPFVAGVNFGKVRAMLDHEGKAVEQAGPATPVEVHGFSAVPEAGDMFVVVEEEKIARQIGEQRQQKIREQEAAVGPASLEDLLARMHEQPTKELNIIIKADVQGSVEALKEALLGIPAQEIKVKIIHGGVGAVTESDVMLATASRAIVIGFNVRPTPKAAQIAEQEKIDIRLYTIIYEAIEEVRKAMEGMLAPIEKESVVGRAEVRQTFYIARIGVIAGCHVVSGKIERSNQVRLLRDNVVIYQGKINSMKRFKEDIKEAQEGYECGIMLENYRDVKIGDIIEAFTIEQESAKLTP
ncbi:MAG: translation initiation factor IF-2, partial [Desulfomonile tiedjei]|nr:translation initiation factor IF-2 [Desulfomonile tiedjei]